MIGLQDRVAALPELRAQCVEHITAILRIRSLQVLEGVDRLYLGEIVLEPINAGFRLAIFEFFEEVAEFIGIEDWNSFEECDLYVVVAGEKERLPFLFFAVFDRQLELGILAANPLCEFVKGRELFVF
jgi:hypothetical protein